MGLERVLVLLSLVAEFSILLLFELKWVKLGQKFKFAIFDYLKVQTYTAMTVDKNKRE